MRSQKLLLFILISIVFTSFNQDSFETSDVFYLKFTSQSGDKIERASASIRKSAFDSLSLLTKREVGITYLLGKYISSDTLKQYLPDTNAVRAKYLQLIENPKFEATICALLYPQKQDKKVYSEAEVMEIASKFVYPYESEKGYMLFVCSGLNGLEQSNSTDTRILEAIVLEAIMTAMMNSNDKQPEFVASAHTYLGEMLNDSALKEEEMRSKLFQKMKSDSILKNTVLGYLVQEKNTLPVQLKR